MEIFVKMTTTEYETFKKAKQKKEPPEMSVESFLRLKGYRLGNIYIESVDKPDDYYEVWENGDDKVLILIKGYHYGRKADCNH